MRRIGSLAMLLTWLASAPDPARAQSAGAQSRAIGGSAANLVPLSSAALAVKSQSVEFTFLPEPHAWDVSAHFELSNLGDRALSAQLALPEFTCDPEGEFDDHCDPSRPGFSQLSATLRERAVRLRKTRPPRAAERGSAPDQLWDFPVQLAAHENLPIDLRYAVPAGVSSEGGWSASYRLRGGASWAKPIGRASFKFAVPAYSCLVIEPEKLPRKSRRVVLREGQPWLELVFEVYVWNPPPVLALYFEPCLVARDTELPACPAASALQRYFFPAAADEEVEPISELQLREALAKLDNAQLEHCRDAVFEAYAGYFEASELKRLPSHPEGQRHYTAPLLTEADWKWVHYLDARLAERPRALQPKAAAAAKPEGGCGCWVGEGRGGGWAGTVGGSILVWRLLRRRRGSITTARARP